MLGISWELVHHAIELLCVALHSSSQLYSEILQHGSIHSSGFTTIHCSRTNILYTGTTEVLTELTTCATNLKLCSLTSHVAIVNQHSEMHGDMILYLTDFIKITCLHFVCGQLFPL